jgi:hypothetical protein
MLRVSSETLRTLIEDWKKSDCTTENVQRPTLKVQRRIQNLFARE